MDGHEANRKCPYAAEGLERGSTSPELHIRFRESGAEERRAAGGLNLSWTGFLRCATLWPKEKSHACKQYRPRSNR